MSNPQHPHSQRPPWVWWWIRLLYNLLFPLAMLLLLPGYCLRMLRRGNYREGFGQRLGLYTPEVRSQLQQGHWIWVHAVSVGEVLIALKLIRSLQQTHPDLQVVLSTTTPTGRATALSAGLPHLLLLYKPLDFAPFVKKAIRLIRPRAIILVEAEVWPNLTHEARRQGIPIALVNARLSPRSERRYLKARHFVAPLFNQLDLICVQEPEDTARWISFGVDPLKIHCTGSIKFDDLGVGNPETRSDLANILTALGVPISAPVLLGASTHPGEELILANIAARLRAEFPALFLILAPRHAERAAATANELATAGFHPTLRSAPEKGTGANILIVDTTGELRDWYPFATVVFVGKSLTIRGGHNPLEPVSAGCPVVFGPHMQNFEIVQREMLKKEATIPVENEAQLEIALETLFRSPERRKLMVQNSADILARHRGATERTRALLALHH